LLLKGEGKLMATKTARRSTGDKTVKPQKAVSKNAGKKNPQFRATLDRESKAMLLKISNKLKLKISPAAIYMVESIADKDSPRMKKFLRFIRDEYIDVQRGQIDSGQIFSWPVDKLDMLSSAAFEAGLNGNRSELLRALIRFYQNELGIES
jgi:hypothetical protein